LRPHSTVCTQKHLSKTINNSAAGNHSKAGQKMADSKKRLLYSRSMNRRWSIAADISYTFGLILKLAEFFFRDGPLWQRTLFTGVQPLTLDTADSAGSPWWYLLLLLVGVELIDAIEDVTRCRRRT